MADSMKHPPAPVVKGRSGGATIRDAVEVSGTARLHLGFLDLNGALGRQFGSIGLSLEGPRTRLLLRRAAADSAEGEEGERAARYLAILAGKLGVPGHHALEVAEAIPAHAGLGSGTQLALALGAAVRHLHGLPPDPEADAALLGRGARSGIGIGLFRSGGLVVDGGPGPGGALPRTIARLPVPEGWRMILLLDRTRRGLSGAGERAAFAALPPMAGETADRICRLVLMQALPALADADLGGFGAAITQIQRIMGDHFAPAQGGRFASPEVARALAALAATGAAGTGQSSWGPTGFAFAGSAAEAERLAAGLVSSGMARGLDIRICRALNRGAAVTDGMPASAPG